MPLLWILYLGYAGLGLGLGGAAAQAAGLEVRAAVHVHLIAMAGFSVLIIGMVTRTALGHLGRALTLDRSMLASYACVIAAAALRLAALWPSDLSLLALQASALAWIIGFAVLSVALRSMADSPARRRRTAHHCCEADMTYVVTESCIKCKYTDCVDVCRVDGFREGKNMLVIDPDECIDCGVCVPECPVEAIFSEDDVPADQRDFIGGNAALAKEGKGFY